MPSKKTETSRTGVGKQKLKETRVPQLSAEELEFCTSIIAGRKPMDAAVNAGWPPSRADALLKRPRIVEFLKKHQETFVTEMAKSEAHRVVAKVPTRGELVSRLWDLANLAPLGVAESISGQVAAAKTIGEIMGYQQKNAEDPLEGLTEDELNRIALYGVDEEGKPKSAPTIQ